MNICLFLWDCVVDEMLLCEYLPLVLVELPKGIFFLTFLRIFSNSFCRCVSFWCFLFYGDFKLKIVR